MLKQHSLSSANQSFGLNKSLNCNGYSPSPLKTKEKTAKNILADKNTVRH